MIYMNPSASAEESIPEVTRIRGIIPSQNLILINNLLSAIVEQTDIPKEQYESWLRTEIGMSDDKIRELKQFNCFPEPAA